MWKYKKGDIVTWKQRDSKIRPNFKLEDFKLEEKSLIQSFRNKEITAKALISKSCVLDNKYFYKSCYITRTGVNSVVGIMDTKTRKDFNDHNIYYILDNDRVIIGGNLKIVKRI